jgi:4-diphosphocytidyl-2-C-methyl-D-erythritol kinase
VWAVEEGTRENRAGPFGLVEELLVNDLEPAARSLCPSIDNALDEARAAGAEHAMVAGSGPTVVGLFADPEGARTAAERLAGRSPAPIATTPLTST